MKAAVGRKRIKFIRQDTNRAKKFKVKWRKPKGLHSKLRLNRKGHQRTPSQGYRSPRSTRGGDKFTLIRSIDDIREGKLMISGKVGLRKKIEIVKYAKEKGLMILNMANPDKFLKDVEEKLNKKKLEKKSKLQKKEIKKGLEKKEEKEVEKNDKEGVKKPVKEVKQTAVWEKMNKSQNIHRATAPKQK